MASNARLRSINADMCSHVRFVNVTSRSINAFWVNYEGNCEFQFCLKPKSGRKVNTYLTHPWLFRDTDTGEFMQVEHLNIFLPQLYAIPDPGNPGRTIKCRKQIVIHLPVHSLRYKCLWKIATSFKKKKDFDIETRKLEIPRTLQDELYDVLKALKKWKDTND